MSCERYRKTLAGLAAGGAPPADVDAHLAACAACRAELASLREGLALADVALREIVSHEPSSLLAGRIARAIAEDREPAGIPSPGAWRRAWAAASAGLLLLVAVAWQRGWLTNAPAAARLELASAPISPPVPPPSLVAAASGFVPPEVDQPRQRAAVARAKSPAEPMVLVPAGEAEALQQYAAELSARIVDPASLVLADPHRALPEPEHIYIEPLTLAPLGEGDRL